MLIENSLFVNENSASEIIWNPDMNRAEAKQKMADYMKYVRAQVCAKSKKVDLSQLKIHQHYSHVTGKITAFQEHEWLIETWNSDLLIYNDSSNNLRNHFLLLILQRKSNTANLILVQLKYQNHKHRLTFRISIPHFLSSFSGNKTISSMCFQS